MGTEADDTDAVVTLSIIGKERTIAGLSGQASKRSLKIVLPRPDCPPQGFLDSGPLTAAGYDLDHEYDYIMQKAMTSYLSHRDEEKEPTPSPARCRSAVPANYTARKYFARRPVQSARLPPKVERVETVPPTVSLDLDYSAACHTPMSLRPKRRPLTATVIRYPITGQKMSSVKKKLPWFKSASEHTTPTKMNFGSSSSKDKGEYKYDGGFFNHRKTRRDFTIHPDWVSENLTVEKLNLNKRKGYPPLDCRYATFPMRRCKSAPPPRARNPITWQD
ncbi:uncharacterized protein LOC135483305 isoform X2 [Lineus longissimus]|uniref:uncharacterized protein LOC135483305 isoform X2 n=1 Tax=Lineus longissimus TaxID=88925 RepID=UPI002B4DF0A0